VAGSPDRHAGLVDRFDGGHGWKAATMASVSKMSELQDALNRYGEVSVQNYKIVHPLGEKIIDGFGGYLGETGNASGVPPAGDWLVIAACK
jgi:hypothetical protein